MISPRGTRPKLGVDIPPPSSQPPPTKNPMRSPRTKVDIPPPAQNPMRSPRTKVDIPPPTQNPMTSPRTKTNIPPPAQNSKASPQKAESVPINSPVTKIIVPPPSPQQPPIQMPSPLNKTVPAPSLANAGMPPHSLSPSYSQYYQHYQHQPQSPTYPQQCVAIHPHSQAQAYQQQQAYHQQQQYNMAIQSQSHSHSPTFPQGYMNAQPVHSASPTEQSRLYSNDAGRQKLPNLDDMGKLYEKSYKKRSLSASLKSMGMLDYKGVSDYCKRFVMEKEASGAFAEYETSLDEAMGISIYTYEDSNPDDCPFRVMNTCLGRIRTMEALERIKDIFFFVVSGLRKLPRFYPTSKTLYRGIRERVDLEMYTRGNVVTWSAFSSASTDMSVIRNFLMSSGDASGTMFIIQGDPWGYDIGDFSFFDDEREILLEPDRRFEVGSVMDQGQLVIIELKMLETPLVIEDLVPPLAPLAEGWSFQKDPSSGKIFYINHSTRKTQWERPSASTEPVLPNGWVETVDPASGRKYYVEMATGKTQWEHPGASSPILSKSPQQQQQQVIPIPVGFKPSILYVDGISLVWNPVRMANIVYVVECNDMTSNSTGFYTVYCGSQPCCTCQGLKPGFRYTFRLCACVSVTDDPHDVLDDDIPRSNWGQPLDIDIPVLPAPINVKISNVSAGTVCVSWEIPRIPVLVPGSIAYQARKSLSHQNSVAYEGNGMRFICKDIQAGFSYAFSVRTFCNGVFSQWSNPVSTQATAICLQYPGVFIPGSNYNIDSERRVATAKIDSWSSNVVGDRPIPVDVAVKWTIKIMETYNNGDGIFIGVAPQSIDLGSNNNRRECGWYFCCYDSSLYSGPPYNYGEYFGERYASTGSLRKGDEVSVFIDMVSMAMSFYVNGRDYGIAYKNIPANEPLVPIVILNYIGDSVKLIS